MWSKEKPVPQQLQGSKPVLCCWIALDCCACLTKTAGYGLLFAICAPVCYSQPAAALQWAAKSGCFSSFGFSSYHVKKLSFKRAPGYFQKKIHHTSLPPSIKTLISYSNAMGIKPIPDCGMLGYSSDKTCIPHAFSSQSLGRRQARDLICEYILYICPKQ